MAVRKIVTYFALPFNEKRHKIQFKKYKYMTETFQVKSLEEMPRALTYLIEKLTVFRRQSTHCDTNSRPENYLDG